MKKFLVFKPATGQISLCCLSFPFVKLIWEVIS